MRKVTRKEFFDALRKDGRDIMPHIVGPYDPVLGYRSVWKDKSDNVFGEDQGKAQRGCYWLKEKEGRIR